MASTNISSNQQRHGYVRVRNNYSHDACEYPLYSASAIATNIVLASESPVIENAEYSLFVLFPDGHSVEDIELSVNGSDSYRSRLENTTVEFIDGRSYLSYPVDTTAMRFPFLLTYGFVRIEIVMSLDGGEHAFTTKDIPCLSKDQYQSPAIERMLNDLLDVDKGSAARWMFARGENNESQYAILDAGLQGNSKKSLSSLIQLLESIIREYDQCYSYFHSHGYSRITETPIKMSPRNIRRVGNRELLWIAKNLETLSETPSESSISYLGRRYVPREIESERKVKTYDSYENRLVLGFLNETILKARSILGELQSGVATAEALKNRLASIESEDYSLPALVLVQQCTLRENYFIDKLESSIWKLRKLKRKYEIALPGVTGKFSRKLNRTKVFQEINAYSGLYLLMRKWLSFGDFTLARENLALHSLRLDKLYEYYSLYRLLQWFENNGFSEDNDFDKPIECAEFSLVDPPRYENEKRVATLYSLSRGDSKIRLYYQPVIYGSEKEEHGISLHRLSPRNPIAKVLKDGYWTPDFLLSVINPDGLIKWHIFDAKYSRPKKLWEGYPKAGPFTEQISKYKSDIGGSASTSKVDSVWLLSGRSDSSYIQFAETSSWAASSYQGSRSGVVSLTPEHSRIDDVLKEIVSIGSSEDKTIQNFEAISRVENESTQQAPSKKDESLKSGPNRRDWTKQSANRCLPLIVELYELIGNTDDLYRSKWAESNLGLAHPLLRSIAPNGGEKKYYEIGNVNGATCYIYKQWLPNHENRLKSHIEKLKANEVRAKTNPSS